MECFTLCLLLTLSSILDNLLRFFWGPNYPDETQKKNMRNKSFIYKNKKKSQGWERWTTLKVPVLLVNTIIYGLSTECLLDNDF